MPCSATLKLIRKHNLQMAGSAKIFTGGENEAILSFSNYIIAVLLYEKGKKNTVGVQYGTNLTLK